ncbi:hypothetical protein VNO78_33094 [Psophocarpus tetragonolobus]|uniref:PXMP2/4 family protein 4 n=1 Tax=Psophocarpus tetragonolobus TaxID=3891 RepID=A0AAN9NWB6_PSOTE
MNRHILHVPRSTMTTTTVSRHNIPKRLSLSLSTSPHRFLAASPPPHFRPGHHHHRLSNTMLHERASLSRTRFSSSTSSYPSPPPKSGFVAWYLRLLDAYPIATKSATSSLVFAAADFTSQIITLPSFPASYDLIRTFRMAIYGLLILGPLQHKWFNFLSNIIPKRDFLSTLKKILMGQVIFGPFINTIFFSYNGLFQGETGAEIIARLKRDLLPTLLGGAVFWPVCDFVTFRFVPVHLQPLLNSACAYVWTIYLTYMANQPRFSCSKSSSTDTKDIMFPIDDRKDTEFLTDDKARKEKEGKSTQANSTYLRLCYFHSIVCSQRP